MNEEACSKLNDLIHLDIDAIHAYRQAIDACTVAEVRDNLTAFMGDHERHVAELQGAVRALGGVPAEGKDLKGFFIEGFTAIASMGDQSALMAMRANEELTTRRYDAARKAGLTPEALVIVERNYTDEVRHLDWIKAAIDRKIWDVKKSRAA